jgi:hypothetical protein
MAAANGFPVDDHVILQNQLRLPQRVAIAVMNVTQRALANGARVQNQAANYAAIGVIGISRNPTFPRRKP